jgi:hypothetical protein
MDLSWVLGLLVSAATYALLTGPGRPAPAFTHQDGLHAADDPARAVKNGAVS